MTPRSDIEDTSKALYSDGNWYMMPKSLWASGQNYDYPHDSVIYHQCRNHWLQQDKMALWTPPVLYRVELAEMEIPCGDCHEVCPEGLQGLWTLHNFNSLQSDPS